MKNTMLMGNDILELEELFDIVEDISELYDKLCLLELLGKKETDEYKSTLSSLSKKVYLENQFYSRLMPSYSKCIAIIDYLNELSQNCPSIMSSKKRDNKVYQRIVTAITEELENKYIQEESDDEIPSLENRFQSPYIISEMQKAFNLETLINSLTILEEYANNPDYEMYKSDLASIKYDLSFSNKNIETDMLIKRFVPSRQMCSTSKIIAECLNVDDLYNYYVAQYVSDMSEDVVSSLLRISDADYVDDNYYFSSILYRAHLRSIFLLLDDTVLINIEGFTENCKRSPEYTNNKIGIQFINEVLLSVKKDKKIYGPAISSHTKIKKYREIL